MECSVCGGPTKLCCSRCMKSYYCSQMCQKKDYSKHKIKCSPRSADILVKSVFDDLIPTNEAVLYEYGFNNCIENSRDQCMMLGLYAGLVKYLDISATQLHSWWESGDLALNIKKTYEEAGMNSGYYQWFLENEHLFRDLCKYEGEKSDKIVADRYFKSVIPYLSEHDQKVSPKSLSEPKRHVIGLYIIILTNCIPRIELDSWIDFGFASCKYGDDWIGEKEEVQLLSLYRELIIKKNCKIDEFNDAYMSGKVLDLLKRKCDNNPWLSENKLEFRGYRQSMKSVYSLKQYVLCESLRLVNPVRADYGFMNCRTANEITQLKNMYNKLIRHPKFDPQELHEACIKGKIFNYVKSILPSNELVKAKLLKNLYPLPDL
ncbi:hypothetical protein Glove_327g5 [Diversispora epigaea]|uniref:MYND-type domain-containing protein n=1 Tax=Diversispora epigaea TaxID=1348612 RepID=A0A397HL34_9GLOM|nr:hypothetical protein Glove_327g5 [Diversispora epigaea]